MEASKNPVFYTNNPSRWKRFKGLAKILIIILLLGVSSVVASMFHKQVLHIPSLVDKTDAYQNHIDSLASNAADNKEMIRLKKIIKTARKTKHHEFYAGKIEEPPKVKEITPVHAGFFVNWDIQARYSLKNNISRMNVVLPEWFFVQDSSDAIYLDIDSTALSIMRRGKVAIIPMVSNYFNNRWNGDNVHRIITSAQRRSRFINSILQAVEKYHFNGVNIDFEDLHESTDAYMIAFQRELYKVFQAKGLLVTQDIAPFNEDYNLEELSRYNDFIFLMAYDEHNAESSPGPVASQLWVEASLDNTLEKVDPSKLVLCVAGYGYDWKHNHEGADVTYQEAISTALESEGKVRFDNKSLNLSYTYYDDDGAVHQVFFTDAISDFNAIRAAADQGVAGYALWRLGSEDSRIWRFYDADLSGPALEKKPFQFTDLETISSSYNVDYIGAGEILDIVSTPQAGRTELEFNDKENAITEETYTDLPSSFVISKTGEKEKNVVLSFDDGPDSRYTPRILDILNEYKVPAVFFVTGINAEQNLPLVKRIYDEGHEIGNHTFLHPNLENISDDRLRFELRSTGYLIEGITGHATMLFRPPYNTDAEPVNPVQIEPLAIAKSEGYLTIGSSIDPLDWQIGVKADTIVSRAIQQQSLGNIILMHDAGGDREETVKALPRVIEYYQQHGYKFVSLASLMDKDRNSIMPAATGKINLLLQDADQQVFTAGYYLEKVLSAVFLIALVLSMAKIVSIFILASVQKRRQSKEVNDRPAFYPRVSIIVPAFNEEVTALKTIDNLLGADYPDFEIIFVDDGSKDNTYARVNERFGLHPRVKVFSKANGGKASALNYGILQSSGELLVCIDADTILHRDAIRKLIPSFRDPKVGAVAGNVKVGNRVNLLTQWQHIEYTTSQNFDRRAFDVLNGIMVVPGAIGAFRKEALVSAGGFDTDTLAEDCDLTLRLLRNDYQVVCRNDALAFTEAPESLKMLLKQRFRWSFGIMQSFWKHWDLLFTRNKKNLGWIVLPHMLIFQLILPLLSPIVDLTLLISLFMPGSGAVIALYFAYFLLDLVISVYAFRMEGEKFNWWLIPMMFLQRILYRQILWFVLVKAYLRALKGEVASWGILNRTGKVGPIPAGL